ncbi:hypothetical protein ACFQBQ_10760 [Granulicella cerasi]|uniref:Uncharacterized protein n=1 Tax=Granulicella cerasi TaxID=741063 RepID=A0ABW1Z9G6_9BACT
MTFLLRRPSALALPLAAAFTMAPALLAQQHHAPAPAGEKQTTTVTTEPAKPAAPSAVVPDAVSEGSVTVGGKKIDYRAVAGLITVGANDTQDATIGLDGRVLPEAGVDLPAKVEDQPATARIFYTAYFAKGADPATRPVVFIYNGGPGSATMYLRMSSIGPVRVELPDLQHPFGGPYKLVNNDDSLLDVADLVFIDAPGTGYSRVQGRDAMKAFYGIDEDASAFDRFIRRWLSKNDRWMSPKFLFGESYGTTRDAALSRKLQQSGVDLNGVVFLSQILSFQNSADGSDRNPATRTASSSHCRALRQPPGSITRCPASPQRLSRGSTRSSSMPWASTLQRCCRVRTSTLRRRLPSRRSWRATPAFRHHCGLRRTFA